MALRAGQKYIASLSTVLAMLFMAGAALGCSTTDHGPVTAASNFFYIKICFFASVGLILAIAATYLARGRKGLWILVSTIASGVILTLVTVFAGIFVQDCGTFFVHLLEFDVLIFLSLFVLQIISWVFQIRSSRLNLR